MKKLDVVIIAAVAALGALLFGLNLLLLGGGGAYAAIYVNNAEYARIPLHSPQVLTIDQGSCVNVVEVYPGGVRMLSSTCQNQLCVAQGSLEPGSGADVPGGIVCLPNGVSITLEGE